MIILKIDYYTNNDYCLKLKLILILIIIIIIDYVNYSGTKGTTTKVERHGSRTN